MFLPGPMAASVRAFFRDESGATTSEFVVLAAGVVALAVTVSISLADSSVDLADDTSAVLQNVSFQPSEKSGNEPAMQGTADQESTEQTDNSNNDAGVGETQSPGPDAVTAAGTPSVGESTDSAEQTVANTADNAATASAQASNEPAARQGRQKRRGLLRRIAGFMRSLFG